MNFLFDILSIFNASIFSHINVMLKRTQWLCLFLKALIVKIATTINVPTPHPTPQKKSFPSLWRKKTRSNDVFRVNISLLTKYCTVFNFKVRIRLICYWSICLVYDNVLLIRICKILHMSFKAVTMFNNLMSVTNLDRRKTISVDFHKKKLIHV